jgi:ABC-2 type transport system ATP-binding protein
LTSAIAKVSSAAGPITAGSIITAGLARCYGADTAVADLDLTIAEGQIFGLLGPNGAGKTTVVRMLCTLLAPTRGSATIAGLDVVRQPARVRAVIGAAQQQAALDPLMTGRELMALQAALQGLDRRTARQRADALLERFELATVAGKRIKTYSGGMRRRLDLALALIHQPRVLFLDEPTTGVDPVSRQAIWEQVRELRRDNGTTVFLTTQYLEEADRLCDEIAIMDHGELVRRGTPQALKSAVDVPALRLVVGPDQRARAAEVLAAFGAERPAPDGAIAIGLAGGPPAVAAVVRALDEAQVIIEHLHLDLPTLDDVFADATGRQLPSATAGELARVGTGAAGAPDGGTAA